jgi:hypothetical protein
MSPFRLYLTISSSSLANTCLSNPVLFGVFQKSSGAKINKIDDNDFKTHMASDILFLSETHTSYADTLIYTFEIYIFQIQ